MQVFSPSSLDQIKAVRRWLQEQNNQFKPNSIAGGGRLWLGFVLPRSCDGTGRLDGWFSQWNSIEFNKMNQELFTLEEPNNKTGQEFCTASVGMDQVWDVDCYNNEYAGYAVCEANLVAF